MTSQSTNNSRNRYFPSTRKGKNQLFAYYDAQPAVVRDWFQNFHSNVWPGSYAPLGPSDMAEAERRHLAGLRAVWGDDHPAVIDAAKRIQIKGKRIVETLSANDLDGLF